MTPENLPKVVHSLTDIDLENIEVKREIRRSILDLTLKQIKWLEELWSDDLRTRALNQRYLKRHPDEAKLRERSLVWVSRLALLLVPNGAGKNGKNGKDGKNDDTPLRDPRDITPEDLEKLNLSEAEIERLAGLKEKNHAG